MRLNHERTGASERIILCALLSLLILQPAVTAAQSVGKNQPQRLSLQVPASLRTEHAEIHANLEAAIGSGGNTGRAAQEVAKLLQVHFVKEEEFAFPILALLPGLTRGKSIPNQDEIIRRSEKLKVELPQMLQEHRAIVEGLTKLLEAAKKENKVDQIRFVEKLKLHAQTEEELLYPTAVMIGEYLKLRR